MNDQIKPAPVTQQLPQPSKSLGDIIEEMVEAGHEQALKYLHIARDAGAAAALLIVATWLIAVIIIVSRVTSSEAFDKLGDATPVLVIVLVIHVLARALDVSFAWIIKLIAGTVLLVVAWELSEPMIGDYVQPFLEVGKSFLSWGAAIFQ